MLMQRYIGNNRKSRADGYKSILISVALLHISVLDFTQYINLPDINTPHP